MWLTSISLTNDYCNSVCMSLYDCGEKSTHCLINAFKREFLWRQDRTCSKLLRHDLIQTSGFLFKAHLKSTYTGTYPTEYPLIVFSKCRLPEFVVCFVRQFKLQQVSSHFLLPTDEETASERLNYLGWHNELCEELAAKIRLLTLNHKFFFLKNTLILLIVRI